MGFFSPEMPLKKTAQLTRSIVDLYDGGIPLIRAIDLIRDQHKRGRMRDRLIIIGDDLRAGATLSQAFEKHRRFMSPVLLDAIYAGEVSGNLVGSLREAADYFDQRIALIRSLIKAAAYPICVFIAAVFIIPPIQQCAILALQGRDDEIGAFLGAWAAGWAIALGSYYCMGWVLWRIGVLDWMMAFLGRYIWPFKSFMRDLALSRFFRVLAMMMGSVLPVKQCVQRAALATRNPIIARELMKAITLIDQCATLQEAFARCHVLPPMARAMLATGEYAGSGPELWRKVAASLQEDAYHRMKSWIHVMDGMLILIVAFMIFGGPHFIFMALGYLASLVGF